jgi:hypothetical protein
VAIEPGCLREVSKPCIELCGLVGAIVDEALQFTRHAFDWVYDARAISGLDLRRRVRYPQLQLPIVVVANEMRQLEIRRLARWTAVALAQNDMSSRMLAVNYTLQCRTAAAITVGIY